MRFIKNTLLLLILFSANISISQNMNIAKGYYNKAKESYATNSFTKSLEYIESTKKELGNTNPDITYLEVLVRFKIDKKDSLIKSLSYMFLENADQSDDRIEEVSLIVIEHEEIINNELAIKQRMYNTAITNGSVDQIRAYINKYPKSEEVGRVKLALEEKETQYYNTALKMDTVKYYEDYLDLFPRGVYKVQVNSKLNIAKEVESYNKVKTSSSIDFIEGHLKIYPQSEHKEEILERLEALMINEANTEFKNESNLLAQRSYNDYLRKFPEGKHVQTTNDNLDIIQKRIDKQNRIDNITSANYFMLTYATDETYGIQFGKLSQNKVGTYLNLSGNESVSKLKFSADQEADSVGQSISVFEESILKASFGLTVKIVNPIWVYGGGGLKYREFFFEDEGWEIKDLKGFLFYYETGIQIKIGKALALKGGASFIDGETYIQAGIGILTRNW
ncbi:hypothetical protein HSX10_08480 [Winogradskyella undariae]|uniref:hypothetical protein n=1 Tax=Winogradskyella TaxID=286104 RepID=UPI00156BCB4D|nr:MULTISPECIES: hypothetical protein [Winogradskyella]NRR91594.1 hypothetical protein [Winogradskyella undariae]QXP77809.1 hypothetical protein H0I32_11340 [Winogradskyella sp. HaHa_3_26]